MSGNIFSTQNGIFSGAYINFTSASGRTLDFGGDDSIIPQIMFFLSLLPIQSNTKYVITQDGIIEPNAIIME